MTWLYVPSSPCSNSVRGLGGLASDCDSPESTYEPWLVLSGTATRRPLSWRAWRTRPWIERLSGTILNPSMAQRGVDGWIWSLLASRVSRSPRRGRPLVLMTPAGSGLLSPESSLMWNPDTSSWRTSHVLWPLDYPKSSVTLPRSGSMRSGVCSPRPPLVPPTSVSVFGSSPGSLWPTPTATDSNPNTTGSHGTTLTDRAVRMWGTPVARDDQKSPEAHLAMKARMGGGRTQPTSLTVQAKMWSTPRASMNENRTTKHAPSHGSTHGRTLAGDAAGLHSRMTEMDGSSGSPRADLNPRFVEALLGLPKGWLTPSTSVETGWYREWLRKHSPPWQLVLDAEK